MRSVSAMVIILIALAALILWGALASILKLKDDGYGRPEIRDRNRAPEQLTRRPGQSVS
jgi:hypothetical protein